jgi:NDP-sugar pyrophosphorylase family protein
MNAGIIAAGWGERLGQKVPKALTPVGDKKLIDFALDGLTAAGSTHVTCIVNESALDVPAYVERSKRPLKMDWIIQTTPSSMHSFLIVLERLAQQPGEGFFLTTVDSVCPPQTYVQFEQESKLFLNADIVLGLTNVIDDEKPLRVAMRGQEDTGLMPDRVQDNPEAFEILAMTNNGFDSEYVTSGFYHVRPRILKEKPFVLDQKFTALRQYLGHLLKQGYSTYGVPLPPVIDVDRPQDIQAAVQLLHR